MSNHVWLLMVQKCFSDFTQWQSNLGSGTDGICAMAQSGATGVQVGEQPSGDGSVGDLWGGVRGQSRGLEGSVGEGFGEGYPLNGGGTLKLYYLRSIENFK